MKKQLLILGIAAMLFSQNGISQNNSPIKSSLKLKEQPKKEHTFQPKALVSKPGKSNNFIWNSTNNAWDNIDSTYYTYDSDGYETIRLNRKNGVSTTKQTTTYNLHHLITEELDQFFNSSTQSFENSYRDRYEYDMNNNVVKYTQEQWNSTSQLWEISFARKSNYTYDANNNILEQISQEYNSNTSLYDNQYKTNYVYVANNRTEAEYSNWNGTSWVKDLKYINEFENNVLKTMTGQEWDGTQYVNLERAIDVVWKNWNVEWGESDVISYLLQEWDGTSWVSTWKVMKTYDAFGGYIELNEEYVNGNWINSYRETNMYDSHLNGTEYKEEEYINNAWEITYLYEINHTYDANDNITQSIWKNWDSQLKILKNSMRKDYADYQTYNNTVGVKNLSVDASVYPNPAINMVTVSSNTENLQMIYILDVSGKILVQKDVVGSSVQLDLSTLSSGVYLIQINTENGQTIKRFVKE